MIKIESKKLRNETKPKINSAISNLNQASSLLTGIKIPDNFYYSSELRGIPSQINEIAQSMKGINTYIEQKIQEFEGARKSILSSSNLNWAPSYQGGALNSEYSGYGLLVTDSKKALNQTKKTGASVANFFISLLKGVGETGEALVDTGTVVVTLPLTLITATQDIGQNIMSGKGLKNIEFNNTKDLWSGTMSNVAEDTVDNAYKDLYKKNKYGRWLDTNAYTPFKSTGVGTKVGEGLGGIAGIIGLTVLTGGAATPAMATKVSTALAGIRGFGEGTEYFWGKQRDSSWAGLERMKERGEISKDVMENYKTIRNMSEKELFDLYRFHQITQEQYDAMKQIKQMPEDWITTKNALSGMAYGGATGAWEALQYYVGNKLNNFSMKGASAFANAAMRVGIDTGFNAGDTPFRAGVESILTGRDYKKVFDDQGGLKSVLISAGVGAIGSTAGEISRYYTYMKAFNKAKKDGTWIYYIDDIDKINEKDLSKVERLHFARRRQIDFLESRGLSIPDKNNLVDNVRISYSDEAFEKRWIEFELRDTNEELLNLEELKEKAKHVQGFYSPKTEKLYLRPDTEIETIIHELNHSLGTSIIESDYLDKVVPLKDIGGITLNHIQTEMNEAFTESIALRMNKELGSGTSAYKENVQSLNKMIDLMNENGYKDIDLKTYYGKDKTLFAKTINEITHSDSFYSDLLYIMSLNKKDKTKYMDMMLEVFEDYITNPN